MIQLDQLTKVFGTGASATTVLERLDFAVERGEIAAVLGPSGAGKSTLAQCVTLLEPPTSGRVIVNGEDLTALGTADLRNARRRIGTVFQSDGLYERRTAAQNVALPLEFLGVTRRETRARTAELLERVGLGDKAGLYPHQLSGGQRQRVGIARALALRPSILLSDEATSGLDPRSTQSIIELLKGLRDELGLSVMFITHEMDTVVQIADTVALLDHGRIVESGRLVDILRDPASGLGAQLRTQRESAQTGTGEAALAVTYVGDVPGDWILRASQAAGVNLNLLGASIDRVHGAMIGTARVAVPAEDADRLIPHLEALGLHAVRIDDGAAAFDAVDRRQLAVVA